MPKLSIRNISKYYGTTKVLDNVSFKVNEGEFLVLVGPSGSGKSTILRIIAGLDMPDVGEIFLDDKLINNVTPSKRNIAMVFQNYALYPHMNVRDNLAFPLKMTGLSKDEINIRLNQVVEMLGIKNHLLKKPKELSGGERQRVALGRAVIRKPALFLMDEPLSNLDAKLRIHMRAEILRLHNKLSATVIYVTHDQIEALTMGSKIVVINDGVIQQLDTPENIYKYPANIFVAGFIGNPGMNIFEFKFFDSENIEIMGRNIKYIVPESIYVPAKKNNLINKEILVGFRPENIGVNSNSGFTLSGVVDLVEMLGNEYFIHLSPEGSLTKNSRFVIKLFSNCKYKQKDSISVDIDLSRAYFFDKLTGQAINFN